MTVDKADIIDNTTLCIDNTTLDILNAETFFLTKEGWLTHASTNHTTTKGFELVL